MIRNYFGVIHITIEWIIIGNNQPAQDVPGMSPKGPKVCDLQETFRGHSGGQYKNWWFYENIVFQK